MTKNKSFQNVKDWIIQAIMCDDENSEDILKAFKSWEPPKFPINGMDLKGQGITRGHLIGYCLDNLKIAWIESDFSLEKDQLLGEILNKIADNYQAPPKIKKK